MLDDWDAEVTEFEGKFEDLIEETVVITHPVKIKPIVAKAKNKKQILIEHIERKNKELEILEQLTPDQIRNRKEEEERLLRESDFINAVNLFGESPKKCAIDDLAKYICSEHSNSEQYPTFLKDLCKTLTSFSNVRAEDVKGMIDTLTIIMNNKIKDEKSKKSSGKKQTKNWSKSQMDVTNIDHTDEYYDFM